LFALPQCTPPRAQFFFALRRPQCFFWQHGDVKYKLQLLTRALVTGNLSHVAEKEEVPQGNEARGMNTVWI
jgi:hypothetical protein